MSVTSSSTPSAFGRHVPALDGVRGLAILWVVLHNAMDVLGPAPSGPFHLLALVTHPGWIGVQLFFVLSGFLITGNLLDSKEASNYLSSFYMRRVLRIFPLYYGVLLVLLVLLPATFGTPRELQPAVEHQAWLWLYLSNWTHVNVYGFAHFWSLAVEEQFYLVWPVLMFRLSPHRLLAVCGVIACAVLVGRSAAAAFAHVSADMIYVSTFARADALVLGAAGAAVLRIPAWSQFMARFLRPIAIGAALLFLLGIPLTRGYSTEELACQTFGYTILALTAAVLVTGVALGKDNVSNWVTRALCHPALRSLGKYSYGIYVFHALIHKLIGGPWLKEVFGGLVPSEIVPFYGICILLVSYLLAFVSFHGFEKHFLKLKRRFVPRELVSAAA